MSSSLNLSPRSFTWNSELHSYEVKSSREGQQEKHFMITNKMYVIRRNKKKML